MTFRVITISGEVASGKSSLANALTDLLPEWRRVNTGQLVRDFFSARGQIVQAPNYLPDKVNRVFDAEQRKTIETGFHVIVEGHLAGWLAFRVEDVLKVYCYASLEIRVERYMAREIVSREKALSDIMFREDQELEYFGKIYGIPNFRSSSLYDLQIDTGNYTSEELAQIIFKELG